MSSHKIPRIKSLPENISKEEFQKHLITYYNTLENIYNNETAKERVSPFSPTKQYSEEFFQASGLMSSLEFLTDNKYGQLSSELLESLSNKKANIKKLEEDSPMQYQINIDNNLYLLFKNVQSYKEELLYRPKQSYNPYEDKYKHYRVVECFYDSNKVLDCAVGDSRWVSMFKPDIWILPIKDLSKTCKTAISKQKIEKASKQTRSSFFPE